MLAWWATPQKTGNFWAKQQLSSGAVLVVYNTMEKLGQTNIFIYFIYLYKTVTFRTTFLDNRMSQTKTSVRIE